MATTDTLAAPAAEASSSLPPSSSPDKTQHGLTELKADSNVWYKIHVLLYDLRHFEQSNVSQTRLETVADPSYIGEPYFSQIQSEKIKYTCLEDGKTISTLIEETLKERLERRIKKREQSGDYRVCAAHDVAPILEKALGIKPRDLERNQAFLDLMLANGLQLGPGIEWTGLGKTAEELPQ